MELPLKLKRRRNVHVTSPCAPKYTCFGTGELPYALTYEKVLRVMESISDKLDQVVHVREEE